MMKPGRSLTYIAKEARKEFSEIFHTVTEF
jgi:hypothetical protein